MLARRLLYSTTTTVAAGATVTGRRIITSPVITNCTTVATRRFQAGAGVGKGRVGPSRRTFSTNATSNNNANNTTTNANKDKTSVIPWYIRRGIRVVQVALLTTMIFQLGYQRGIMEYAQFPKETYSEMIDAALPMSALSPEQVKEFENYEKSPEYKRLSKILQRVVDAAKRVVVDELSHLHPEEDKEKIETLTKGLKKLNSGDWHVVLFPLHDEANAFVTGLCPRIVFVYTGLLRKTHATDDELAMILGHELSHAILSHSEERSELEAVGVGFQMVLLTLVDPLGFTSIIFDYIANSLRQLYSAGFSREEEDEADALGLKIMATACYDIRQGPTVMQKLAMLHQDIPIQPGHHHQHTHSHLPPGAVDAMGSTGNVALPKNTPTGWFDSHPSSTERFEKLKAMTVELMEKYKTENAIKRPTASKIGNQSVDGIKPPHCYGIVADLERSGFSWRFF